MPTQGDACNILLLVQLAFKGFLILRMADSTISEVMPIDLELAKGLFQILKDLDDPLTNSGELNVIHMLAQHADELAVLMQHAELWVRGAWHQTTGSCDFSQLEREAPRCIIATCAWLVTVDNLSFRVKPFPPGNGFEDINTIWRKIKIDFTQGLTGKLGKFFICYTLQKSLRDICGAKAASGEGQPQKQ